MKTILLFAIVGGALVAQGTQAQRVEKRVIVQDTIEGTATPGVAARRIVFSSGPQTMEFVSGVNVGPTVTKAPYSAEAVTESVQTMYDGNRIVQRNSTKQYRDSEGRERREEGAPLDVVFISDPVAKASYTLHPESKTAEKMGFMSGPGDVFMVHASPATTAIMGAASGATFNLGVMARTPLVQVSDAATDEDLGVRMIEGVEAKGSRTVTTIAAGQIGNDRAIEDERWYSPDLQLTVLTRHADPRTGETTYKLVNIQRLEQVRSLFEIPPGYTIHEPGMFTKAIKEEE
jgi:hypothetical protein